MRRFWLLIAFILLACRALFPQALPVQTPSVTGVVPPTAFPTILETPALREMQERKFGYTVRMHPDGQLFVGDRVSFEVIAPPEGEARQVSVQVRLGYNDVQELGNASFVPFGIQGRLQATLTWIWDTRLLDPGDYTLYFTLQPQNLTWSEVVTLLPAYRRDVLEAQAEWTSAHSSCCTVYYLTHTEAERDLKLLLEEIDLQAQEASQRLGVQLSNPITLTILSRPLGHGGFTSQDIYVSYVDRNYTSGNLEMILRHEMIHVLDAHLGGDFRPSLLVEGLAVYLAGGHFKPEPLLPRAAALLQMSDTGSNTGLGWYIPLRDLADNFYNSQHEIGYLEAGALVAFMIQRWGWQDFSDFYRDIRLNSNNTPSQAIEQALRRHFDLNFAALESKFLEELRRQVIPDGMMDDLRLTIAFYDTVRLYQQLLDPSAYFLTPWLVDVQEMRRLGVTADYLRRPVEPINLALETMLAQAGRELEAGRFSQVEQLLQAVNVVLQGVEQGLSSAFSRDALASDYYNIVLFVQDGWKLVRPFSKYPPLVQAVLVQGDQAVVYFRTDSPVLEQVRLWRGKNGWRLLWPWEADG